MKYRSRWVAFLLSFFQCGVVQLYNGQPLKAIAIFCVIWVGYLLVYYFGTVTTFYGLLGVTCGAIVFFLLVMVDAVYNAGRVVALRWYNRWYVYVLPSVIVFVVSLALDLTGFQYLHTLGIQSFKMPSASMIPTLVVGDRLVADFRPSARNVVHRGDLIVFKQPNDPGKTFKNGRWVYPVIAFVPREVIFM